MRQAYLSEVQPPHPFPFNELGSKFKSPTVEELKDVLDFRHLVRCSEYMFLHGTKYGHFSDMGAGWINESFDESEMLQFRDRFHRAVYRVFLAGAVLYRAFNEPFDLARRKQGNEAFLNFSTGEFEIDEDNFPKIRYPISAEDIEYLRTFAVYNFDAEDDSDVGRWRDETYNLLFGPLSKYLVDDGEARGLQKDREVQESGTVYEEDEYAESDFGPGVQGSIEEIMLLIGAYEQLIPQITNADGARSQGRQQRPSEEFGGERTRTITVIIFGIFALEEICMPTVVEESGNSILIARPYHSQPQKENTQDRNSFETSGKALYTHVDIPHVIQRLFCASRRPNRQDGYPIPPPDYQLFVFAARKYLGLRFESSFFEERADSGYVEQIQWGYVFQEAYLPFQEYDPPPVLTYRSLG